MATVMQRRKLLILENDRALRRELEAARGQRYTIKGV